MTVITATIAKETELWNTGYTHVAGLDEVGRGPLAGPVVCGAVIFHPFSAIPEGIADSKKLSAKKRESLALQIKETAAAWAVGEASAEEIDRMGIMKALHQAFERAIASLSTTPDYHIFDFVTLPSLPREKQEGILGGDSLSVSIAAASIVAKVYRDRLMQSMNTEYPQYGFERHKGYGTATHRAAIQQHGPCPIHRKSFLRNIV